MHIELIYSLYSSVQRKHLPGKSCSRQLCVGDAEGSWAGKVMKALEKTQHAEMAKRGEILQGKKHGQPLRNSLCEQSSAELSCFAL